MKKALLFSIAMLALTQVYAQNWTWLRGSTLIAQPGSYGTLGAASPGNDPGARHAGATWVDPNGNLWLFGGHGYATTTVACTINNSITVDCLLNDVWKYNPFTNQWTWMRGSNSPNAQPVYGTLGVSAPGNDPGAREFATYWTDQQGNFWLFGGSGPQIASNYPNTTLLADLWKYDPVSNQWTWMGGYNTLNGAGVYGTQGIQTAGTKPGGRIGAAGWVDPSGKLWLFGGHGYATTSTVQPGYLQDLWRYDPGMGLWTWMSGSDQLNQQGIFGTLGVGASTNIPGGRQTMGSWADAAGNLWLLGGVGYVSTALLGRNNDFWKYNITANTWTWMGGSNTQNPYGYYGTLGVPSTTNMPGGRRGPACWVDFAGDFWLFGGQGYPNVIYQPVTPNVLNDMFRYRPSTGEWTWIKGSDTLLRKGIYGTQGVTAVSNIPGARYLTEWWSPTLQKLWLFGGEGIASQTNVPGFLNCLWKFEPPCNPDSIAVIPSHTVCSGTPVQLTAFNQLPSTVAWYLQSLGGASVAAGTGYTTAPLTAISSPSVYSYFATSNGCTLMPRAAISITAIPLPNMAISGPTTVCQGVPYTLTVTGAATYTWNTSASASVVTFSANPPSASYVVLGSLNGCGSSVTTTISVLPAPVVSLTTTAPTLCVNSSATLTALGNDSYAWNTTQTGNTIVVTPSITTSYSVTATGTNSCKSSGSITQFVSLCAGIGESTALPLSIFPNPSGGTFFLSRPVSSGTTLQIFNLLGANVLSEDVTTPVINCALAPGVYFYRINENARETTGKLVIE